MDNSTSTFPVFFTVLVSILLVTTGLLVYQNRQLRQQLNAPTTYAECLKTPGSVLQESYPATCVTTNGLRFTQPLTPLNETTKGTLEATVMRSPTCPGAQKLGEVCEAPIANGIYRVIRPSDNEVVQTVTTDKNGKFAISLAVGAYQLQSPTTGIGKNIGNPDFTITSGKTTIQQFDIDTGIR